MASLVQAEFATIGPAAELRSRRFGGYLRWVATIAGAMLVVSGSLVAYGWYAHIPELVQPYAQWASMKLNSALAFLVFGLGVLFLNYRVRRAALACALFVGAVGLLTGAQYAFGVNLHIDELFVRSFVSEPGVWAGRMSPIGAGLLVLSGGALALLCVGHTELRTDITGVLASIIAGVALSALMGYATGTPAAYGWGAVATIAIQSAAAFIVAAVALGSHAAALDEEHLPRWLPWAALVAGLACTLALGAALLSELGATSRSYVPELTIVVGTTLSVLMAVSLQAYRRLDAQGSLIRHALARREEALQGSEHAEQRLRDSLHEKELLLKEVHHRVKNNLQVVASMLALQAGRSCEPQSREMLENCRQRVLSMAMVHEKLYSASDLRRIDLGALVRDIAGMLTGTRAGLEIDVTFDIEPIVVDIETAFPASLVINELIANCVKHAFVGRARGAMHICVRRMPGNRVRIVVRDDGVGGVTAETFIGSGSLGSTIVRALTRQLDGELCAGPGEQTGSIVSVTFPISRVRL